MDAKVNVMCNATVGNQIGVIKDVSKLESDEMIDISHVEGQVMLIVFYGTWCPHSKQVLKHIQKLYVENEKNWDSKVRVVGLSIDNVKAKQLQYLKSTQSTAFEHYNVKNGTSKAVQYFGLKRVPTCALIDK